MKVTSLPSTSSSVKFWAKLEEICVWGGRWKGGKIARVVGGDEGLSPKPIGNLSLGAESYVTITLKDFSTVSQILLTLIVCSSFERHIQLQISLPRKRS